MNVSVIARVNAEEVKVIEEVVVIGSKDDTTRQELTTSLGYIDGDRIEREPIFNVEDVFNRVANAFTGTTSFGAYSIRGVNNNGITGSINNSNALASILINQVALGINTGDYLKPSMFDAESVEILRGPQSANQGPNALIGSVYINYRRPEFGSSEGQARFEGGMFDTTSVKLMQNAEVIDDRLAARIVLETRKSDGAVTNTTTGRNDVMRTDEKYARIMLRGLPFADKSLMLDLTFIHNDSDSNPFGLVHAPTGGDLFDRKQPYNTNDSYPAETSLMSLIADYGINDRWALTLVTGYNNFDINQFFDADLTALPLVEVNNSNNEELFSQELRLNYDSDNLSGLLGVFYSNGDYEQGFNAPPPFDSITANKENIKQIAVFGKLNRNLFDRFNLSASLRYNRETRDTSNFANNRGEISNFSQSVLFNELIPSVALSYDLTDQTTLGVSYAEGYQGGGVAFAVFVGKSGSYNPEHTKNYELFLRHQSADGRLLFNANVFYIDWTDQQIEATVEGGRPGFDNLVKNVGESSVKGAEVEVEYLFTDDIGAFLSVGIADTEFEKFVLNGKNLSGLSFPNAPEYNFSVGLFYKSETGLYGSTTFSFAGESYTQTTSPNVTAINERYLLSAQAGYETKYWDLFIWGKNLLDHDYELGVFDGADFNASAYGRVGEPLTIGGGITLKWEI